MRLDLRAFSSAFALAASLSLLLVCPMAARADIYQYTVSQDGFSLVFDEPTVETTPFSVTPAQLLNGSGTVNEGPTLQIVFQSASFCPLAANACVLPVGQPGLNYPPGLVSADIGVVFEYVNPMTNTPLGGQSIVEAVPNYGTLGTSGPVSIVDLSTEAPEIDPAVGTSAMALLGGSMLVLRGRRRV